MRNRRINIGDACDVVLHERERFTPESRLQAVGDMPVDLFTNVDRMFSDGTIKREGALDRTRRGCLTADDLDERNKVRRIEGMGDHAPLRMHAAALQPRDEKPRRARGDDRFGTRCRVDAREELDFERFALRPILLYEIRVANRSLETRFEPQTRFPIDRCRMQQCERFPYVCYERTKRGLGVRSRVGRGNRKAAVEEIRGPTRPNHARSDDCDVTDRRRTVDVHEVLLNVEPDAVAIDGNMHVARRESIVIGR